MGNLEKNPASLSDRITLRAEVEVRDPLLSMALPAAMRLAGCETDMTPNQATVAAWEAKL